MGTKPKAAAPLVSGPHRFTTSVERMPAMLDDLRKAEKLTLERRLEVPRTPGCYLFSEGGKPIYVGQTRNLRRRYEQHTGAQRTHNEASFAFLVAKSRAVAKVAAKVLALRRTELQAHPKFAPHFTKAKAQVAKMSFQFIKSADPVERSMFEIYAALHLGTEEFNSFETH
jgi:hypothetical protein